MNPETRNDIINHWDRRDAELERQIWAAPDFETFSQITLLRAAISKRRWPLVVNETPPFTQLLRPSRQRRADIPRNKDYVVPIFYKRSVW